MAATKLTVREQILTALIAGEAICASDFARRIKSNPTRVTSYLRGLSYLLKREDLSNGPGNRRVTYVANDIGALQERLEENVFSRLGITRQRVKFDDLLSAWGMTLKPVMLDLPKTVHVLMDEPEKV